MNAIDRTRMWLLRFALAEARWVRGVWNNRAALRRQAVLAVTHIIAIVVAFQIAFPQLNDVSTTMLATSTRVLTSLAVWLGSAAVLRLTGEKTTDIDPDIDDENVAEFVDAWTSTGKHRKDNND